MKFVLIGSTSAISSLQSMSSWLIFNKRIPPTLHCCLYVISIETIFPCYLAIETLSSFLEELEIAWKHSPFDFFFYCPRVSKCSRVFKNLPHPLSIVLNRFWYLTPDYALKVGWRLLNIYRGEQSGDFRFWI